eukprot:366388-Chlamydomonas_euryale.AAC.4
MGADACPHALRSPHSIASHPQRVCACGQPLSNVPARTCTTPSHPRMDAHYPDCLPQQSQHMHGSHVQCSCPPANSKCTSACMAPLAHAQAVCVAPTARPNE